ncbi:MAG: chromate transporter [Carnobacterium sp.]|uniref:chromate transporter n=2 Tax=Carnobacterium sp. TaxID=48221 RepID=UPI002FC7CD70
MIYLQLFWSFFQVGLFSFGGGYAALPLIQEQVIEVHSWLSSTEFIDILTISQMTPGPIAINASTFVGTKIAGLPGAIIATIGCVTPSAILVLTLATLYYKYKGLNMVQGVIKGLRPAVVALIASAGLSILLTALFNKETFPVQFADLNWVALVLFLLSLFILRKFKLNPIYIMLFAGFLGVLLHLFTPLV